jgi:hypothetical protein
MVNKKISALVFVGMVLIGLIIGGCVTTPLENTVKLEFGGTLPPVVLSYFDANQLKDIEAKFIVVQGQVQVFSALGFPKVEHVAVLITVGKSYRIVQMSKYIKPRSYTDSITKQYIRIPGEHQRLNRIDIVPNMVVKYNTLQEAQLASELGA